jgi:AraC-like DNA-binding protein/TolB-like protein/Tfp pilus assembly protein PilF
MQEPISPDQILIRKLTEIILANLENENFGVDELAHESGISLYRLGRKLQSINKKTVNQFIREVRLQKALEMLRYEPYTAAEVAYKTGFGSPAYFNKCFHEYFGYPPGRVTKGEINNDKLDNLAQGTVNIKPGRTKKKAFVFTLPGILIFAVLLSLAGFLVYKRAQKAELSDNLLSPNGRISIAVLPFQNMTNDTIWNIWQDAIQQDLISSLSMTGELKIRQKELINSLLQSQGVTEYAAISPEVAGIISQKLDADIFIYGNIQQAGSTLRLNAQLIDTRTKDVLGSIEQNGPCKEEKIFDITDSLRKKVTDFLLKAQIIKENTIIQHHALPVTNSPEALRYFIYGEKARREGDFSSAINWGLKALACDSNFTDAAFMLENSYSQAGNSEQSYQWLIKNWERRNQMVPDCQVYASWAYAYSFESPAEQIKYLNQLLQFDDKVPGYLYLLGLTYNNIKEYDKAVPELEKSLAIYRKWGKDMLKNNPVFWALGTAYHMTGHYNKEKKLYNEAEKYSRYYRPVITMQAVLSFAEKDSIAANRYIERYISAKKRISSSEADIAAGVGDIYFNSGLMDKVAGSMDRAEKYYRKALLLEPDNPSRMNTLANFFIESKRNLNEVTELMDKAMALAPTKTDYYNYMNTKGWGLYKSGKNKEALEILQKTYDEAPFKVYSIKSHLEEARKAIVLNK